MEAWVLLIPKSIASCCECARVDSKGIPNSMARGVQKVPVLNALCIYHIRGVTNGMVIHSVAMFNRVPVLDPLDISVTCEEADCQPIRKCFVEVVGMFCGA